MIVTPAYIVPRHDLSLIEIDHLEDRLYDHNRRSTGRDDGKALGGVDTYRIHKTMAARVTTAR
jgi:hypothetical protein